jgi:hypothetical protein
VLSRSRWAQLGVLSLLAGVISVLPSSGSVATAATPTVQLRTVLHHQNVVIFPHQGDLFLTPGVYLASLNGAFEIDAFASPNGTVKLWQVRRDSNGAKRIRAITPAGPVDMTLGLPAFLHASLRNARGVEQGSTDMPFCPGGGFGMARSDGSGPDNTTYPLNCGSPLTKAAVWGIDQGWAAPLFMDMTVPRLKDGEFTLTIAVNPSYASQLGVPPALATTTVGLTITNDPNGGCKPGIPPCAVPQLQPVTQADRIRQGEGPAVTAAPSGGGSSSLAQANGTPDMRALPAHDLSTEHNTTDGHDYLDFGATIWNGGSGPLVVEGFRAGDSEVMPATQFIYQNGKAVRSYPAGQFEFDTRPGHDHWHMEDIAQYDLLDSSGNRIVLSDKQSFCLAPTDPIDLTTPGADWTPDQQGLWSACDGEQAIWLREVLPAGWGDTYFQTVAGQSFDITNTPNGKYFVRVTTDPSNRLTETDYTNNTSLLGVQLGGTAGNRTVTIVG